MDEDILLLNYRKVSVAGTGGGVSEGPRACGPGGRAAFASLVLNIALDYVLPPTSSPACISFGVLSRGLCLGGRPAGERQL